jgi:hypothetical protein
LESDKSKLVTVKKSTFYRLLIASNGRGHELYIVPKPQYHISGLAVGQEITIASDGGSHAGETIVFQSQKGSKYLLLPLGNEVEFEMSYNELRGRVTNCGFNLRVGTKTLTNYSREARVYNSNAIAEVVGAQGDEYTFKPLPNGEPYEFPKKLVHSALTNGIYKI